MHPKKNILNIDSAHRELLHINELPTFCKLPISYAQPELIHLTNAKVLKQTFHNYLTSFDLLEALVENQASLKISLERPGIYIFLVFKGDFCFSNQNDSTTLKDSKNYCFISYMPAGNYLKTITPGEHTALIISCTLDWFITQTQNLELFNNLIQHYTMGKTSVLNLPHCPLERSIVRPFKKLRSYGKKDIIKLDIAIHAFLNQFILYYYNKLHQKCFTSKTLRKHKAQEIKKFVKENFSKKIVENTPEMADLFCVSEKNLHRLSKAVFGIPLHEQVVHYRMVYSIKLILTTAKPIHEIAKMMGYSSSFYFSKAFKKYHKVSPIEIRKVSFKKDTCNF